MVDRTTIADFRADVRKPDDFDAFWDTARAELARVPASITVEPSTLRSTPEIECSEIRYSSLGGVSLFGWLCRARQGSATRPGLVVYPGYSQTPGVPRLWAKAGFVVLQLSPRGHHLSNAKIDPGFPGLMTMGIDDPTEYVYRGMYCDVWRALDVIREQPGVDATRIGVTGGSQGGALSLIAASAGGLAAVAADVPFLTGIRDSLKLGGSYPYEEVKDYLRVYPQLQEGVLRTLDYVDTLQFAERITAPTLLSIGLRDDICPPHTGFALFNLLRCEKELKEYPDGAHEGGGFLHGVHKMEFLKRHLKPEAI